MKQIKTLLIASILILGANQKINAQAKKAAVNQTTKTEVDINQPAKTAHVDVSEIMSKMPAMLDAQKLLEKLSITYQNEFTKMQDELEAKYKKYEEEASIPEKLSAVLKADRQKELADMQKRIQEYGQNAQKELQQKEKDITNPIIEKVKASIQRVGKEKGFQYILDGATLLLADGPNLTADVKKDLGF